MIRLAIKAGGIDITPHPISAKDCEPYLTKYGFLQTNDKLENAKKGDITVIQSYQGQSHSHGHMAMYNGSMWISDFKQRDMWSGPGYRKNKPDYTIYRWENNV